MHGPEFGHTMRITDQRARVTPRRRRAVSAERPGAGPRILARVDPFTVSTTISKPREEVFEYLADIANHAEFTDHYLVDWHLTREDSYGTGAGARFRIKAPLSRFSWADMTFAEVQPPYRIVERGRGGKFNRIRMLGTYTLSPGPGGSDPGRVHARDRAGDAVGQADGGARRPLVDRRQTRQGDAAAADDPRGGPRPGPAGRRSPAR